MNPLGHTRSSRQPTHLLHTPDTFVRTPLPGLSNGVAIVHACPALGAAFVWFTVELQPHGTLAPSHTTQRFFYILEGSGTLAGPDGSLPTAPGVVGFSAPADPLTLTAATFTRCVIIEKTYGPLPGAPAPPTFILHADAALSTPLNGDPGIQVRTLLPADFRFDFAVNLMTYAPSAALSQVEIHYMEHGLLMLSGSGPYVLGEHTYPVQTGDFIWMAPFCPQWFQADPSAPASYLIYKNFNRSPTL